MKNPARRSEGVIDPEPFLVRENEPRATQISEMARSRCLRYPKDLDEIADADLPLLKQVKNPKAGSVGESAKNEVDAIRGG